MLKNWIDFLTIVTWTVLGLTYLPMVIRDRKNFGYYTTWFVYLVLATGVLNVVLKHNVWRIS